MAIIILKTEVADCVTATFEIVYHFAIIHYIILLHREYTGSLAAESFLLVATKLKMLDVIISWLRYLLKCLIDT